jgi:hypothetical protein
MSEMNDDEWLAKYDEAKRNHRYWSEKVDGLNRELLAAEHMWNLTKERLEELERARV